MNVILLLLALALLAATLAPLSKSRRWYIRAMDFPRVQIAVLAGLWLLYWGFADSAAGSVMTVAAVSMLAVLTYQLFWILPYTQLNNVEVQYYNSKHEHSYGRIRLLGSNVLMDNRNAQALLQLVRTHQPDILITLESDQWWQEQLDVLTDYPHRLACPLDNLYGMHVYSRLPIVNPVIEYLVEPDKPSMSMQVKLDTGHLVHLYVVHPAPPAPGENEHSIERDVELILIAKAAANLRTDASESTNESTGIGANPPLIVAGDLNDVAWSATTRLFRQISGLKDPRVGRGIFNTFNAQHWFIRWPLDHVFASGHFKLGTLQRLPDIGSDHFPLLAELVLTQLSPHSSELALSEPELLDEIMQTDTADNASEPSQP